MGEADDSTTPTKPRRTKRVRRKEGMLNASYRTIDSHGFFQPNWIHATYWKENIPSLTLCRPFYGPPRRGNSDSTWGGCIGTLRSS
jgi:hypothetical protein